MSGALHPSAQTVERQSLASHPATSAWVSANAGSGKTTVLARRVVRLLLAGAPPSKILCLTFTKAAAANMALKVFDQLAAWTQASDEALRAALQELEGHPPDPAMLGRARRLFAAALETPGGLKVLTIHAFCERVLHQFPFEANVPAAFAAADERMAAEMMESAQGDVLARAAEDDGGDFGRALADLVTECSDQAITTALGEMVADRAALAALLPARSGALDLSRVRTRLATALDIEPGADATRLDAAILDQGIPADRWLQIAAWLGDGGATDQGLAADLLTAYEDRHDADACRTAYLRIFFKKEGGPRKQFVTKPLRNARADLAAILDAELERLVALDAQRKAAATLSRTLALLRLADAVRLRYEEMKARRGALDFADLIHKTRALLQRSDAAWVLYKLDGGIDHLLVDEAQDTSPEQWAIVRLLTAEFTAGAGARQAARTVFAVGDEKQSIYSFQGAAPAQFGEMRRAYARDFTGAELPFASVELTESFRSTGEVLGAVDAVFAHEAAHAGLSSERASTLHTAARRDGPGVVALWPPVALPRAERPAQVWDLPVDVLAAADPVHVLAQRIATAAQAMIAGGDGPPAAPGDILVLVRTRGPLFAAILGALKAAGVPVAGADRLELTAHIAVRDLLALADVLLLPVDDLALAAVLKSPLFGWTDEDLIAVAPGREGSLWSALGESEAARRLARLADEARDLPPFDLFARLLGRDGGRRAFRARLGAEVDDPLDEFLRLALEFARDEPPTLAAFVHWMRAAPTVIKRDLDVAPEAVRVMTVHGAKGLEAPIVIFADFGAPEGGRHDPKIFHLREPGAEVGAPDLLVFAPTKDDDPPAVAAARAAVREEGLAEHRRLLYVALTRARDRLVVAGHTRFEAKSGGPVLPPQAWYSLVSAGWEHHPGVLRTMPAPADGAAPMPMRPPDSSAAAPEWLHRPFADNTALPTLRPSRHGAAAPPDAAVARGALVHRLLQVLAGRPAEDRADLGARLLPRIAGAMPVDEREAALHEVLALMAQPAFAHLFTDEGRSEVPIAGRLAGPGGEVIRVSGRIDRLIYDGVTVHLVDFKSDRPAPAAVPAAYRRQLALYARVLAAAWPGRRIRAAVLWTVDARLTEVPQADLDTAIGHLPPV